jgi:hypothetical protein
VPVGTPTSTIVEGTGTSALADRPSGWAAGGRTLAIVHTSLTTGGTVSSTGFTQDDTGVNGTVHRMFVLSKAYDAGDPSQFTFNFSVSTTYVIILVFLPNCDGIDDVTFATASGTLTLTAPAATAVEDGSRLICAFGTNVSAGETITPPTGHTTLQDASTAPDAPVRRLHVTDAGNVNAGSTGTHDATLGSGTPTIINASIVASPAPSGETLRPTSIRNLTNLTGAVTDIDDDPDAGGTDFLVGTDPVTPGSNGPQYPTNAIVNPATGLVAPTVGTSANINDTSDTTSGTLALAATNTDNGIYLSFPAAAFSGVPADATITSISLDIKHQAGTANRWQTHVRLDSANGSAISAEKNTVDNTAGSTTTLPNTLNTHTVNAFSALPTRAQLVSGTFGVRLRVRRSNTSTYNLYSVKATVSYTVPSTVNTKVEALMGNPTAVLATGAGTGEIRIQAKKLGSGSNPQVRAEIHENASATVLATPIANTTVSDTTSDGTVLSGTFDQSVITAPNDVEVWIIGTGASGGLVEIGSAEWNAEIVEATQLNLTGVASDESVGVLTPQPGTATRALTGLASEETVGVLVAEPADRPQALTGVASEESTGVLTAQPQTATRALTGVASDEQVGTLTSQVSNSESLTGVPSEESVGVLTAAAADVSAALTGVASDESVGALTAQGANMARALTGLSTEEQVGALIASPDTANRQLTGVASDEQVGTLAALPDDRAQALTGVASEEQVGALTAQPGPDSQPLTGVASEETTGTLTPVPGDATRQLTGVPSDESVGNLAIEGDNRSFLSGVASDELVGSLSAVAADVSIALIGVASDEGAGALTEDPATVNASLSGLVTEELVGSLAAQPGDSTVTLVGVGTDEIVGILSASGKATVALTGLATEELVGALDAQPEPMLEPVVGVPTDELVGTLLTTPGTSIVVLPGVPSGELVGALMIGGEWQGEALVILSVAPKPKATLGVTEKGAASLSVSPKPRAMITQ